MPATRRTSSGSTRANSTAAAPRSFLLIVLPPAQKSAQRGAPRVGPRWATGRGRPEKLCSERAVDVLEETVERPAERADGEDDHDGDQTDEQAVLDGRGAAVLAVLEAAGDDGQHGEQVCVC